LLHYGFFFCTTLNQQQKQHHKKAATTTTLHIAERLHVLGGFEAPPMTEGSLEDAVALVEDALAPLEAKPCSVPDSSDVEARQAAVEAAQGRRERARLETELETARGAASRLRECLEKYSGETQSVDVMSFEATAGLCELVLARSEAATSEEKRKRVQIEEGSRAQLRAVEEENTMLKRSESSLKHTQDASAEELNFLKTSMQHSEDTRDRLRAELAEEHQLCQFREEETRKGAADHALLQMKARELTEKNSTLNIEIAQEREKSAAIAQELERVKGETRAEINEMIASAALIQANEGQATCMRRDGCSVS